MFELKSFQYLKNILSHFGEDIYEDRWGQHHLELRPRDLKRWIEFIRNELGYLTLIDIVAVDRTQQSSRWGLQFEIVYVLFNMGTHQRIHLHVHFNPDEIIPSVVSYYPHADWMEREQAEMLGIKFDCAMVKLIMDEKEKFFPIQKKNNVFVPNFYTPKELPKPRINPNKSEAPYPEESWVWKRYDILSSETMGNFELQTAFDPIKVVQTKTTIGFHHRGTEQLMEGRTVNNIVKLIDPCLAVSSPTYSAAWAKSLEEMLQIKLPERAQAIRIVILELARVAEHLTVLHDVNAALNKDEARLLLDAREKIYELFEKYCGNRQGFGVVRIGGVQEDLPHGWIAEYQSVATLLNKNLKIIHKSLFAQRSFRSGLDSSGVDAQTALQWGLSGPAMRASGLNFDLRKSQPFYFYQDIDFDVPVGVHGTAYDRYLIRYEEIYQSLRIVTQVLDNLPLGDVINMSHTGNFSAYLHLYKELVNAWHYSSIESASGEAGFLLLCSEGATLYRMKVKTPSLAITQALPEFLRGLEEWQLKPSIASLGIKKSELDR